MMGWWGGRRTTAALATALVAFTLFYRDLFERRVTVFRDQYTTLLALDWVRLLAVELAAVVTPFQVLGKLPPPIRWRRYYPLNRAAPAALPARRHRLARRPSRAASSASTRCCADATSAAKRRRSAACSSLRRALSPSTT
jgi:hypothetical protein